MSIQSWHLPRVVACRRSSCQARRGHSCRTSTGWDAPYHKERRADVAHYTDADAERALAELAEEQHQHRAQVTAAMAERDADPVYRAQVDATHAAVRAAVAKVDADLREEARRRRESCRDPVLHDAACQCRDPNWTPPPPLPSRVGPAPVADLTAERARRRITP